MADRTPLYPSPSMLVMRRAMFDGLFGDSRVWKVLAFVIIGRRMLQRIMGSQPRVVAVERIRPGETLIMRGVTGRPPKRS